MLISVVSPVYKAESLVEPLVEQIEEALDKITDSYEIILVEDCGPDNSWQKIKGLSEKKSKLKGIKLSRNFGQQYAIQAGIDAAVGDFVVTMDCDLQDRPDQIIKLYQKALEGYDIVQASRISRKDSFLKKLFSSVFYKLLSYLSQTEQDSSIANFVIINRPVINALKDVNDYRRYYPMLLQWIGFKRTKVEVLHSERPMGKSSYNFRNRINLALDTILTFSDKPLKLAVKLGFSLAMLASLISIIMIPLYFLQNIYVPGWASLSVLLTFFSGIIICILGVVGLYVGKTFETVKKRPTYIVHKKCNF